MTNGTEVINDVASSLFELEWNLNQKEKKMLRSLFFEYRSEGLDSKNALKKAVCIIACFK